MYMQKENKENYNMKIYSIFDDLDKDAIRTIEDAGGYLTVHPLGIPRPDATKMKAILEDYDCVIIGTSQKITEDMFDTINTPKVIATASVGIDHIRVPEDKKDLITIINTPKANAQAVAEYTIGCALACCKRLVEGVMLYKHGKDNKELHRRPEDLAGKTLGVIGAGNISEKIIEYALLFGLYVICWTRNPDNHKDIGDKGVEFVCLWDLVERADIISVNLPDNAGTKGIISSELVNRMKNDAVFISVSRVDTVDVTALLCKARKFPSFYLCLDLDVDKNIVEQLSDCDNVMVTPHIAGGTVESRKRMFLELAMSLVCYLGK